MAENIVEVDGTGSVGHDATEAWEEDSGRRAVVD
jgi:hypothetical protein